jgi:hypothetical protein
VQILFAVVFVPMQWDSRYLHQFLHYQRYLGPRSYWVYKHFLQNKLLLSMMKYNNLLLVPPCLSMLDCLNYRTKSMIGWRTPRTTSLIVNSNLSNVRFLALVRCFQSEYITITRAWCGRCQPGGVWSCSTATSGASSSSVQ